MKKHSTRVLLQLNKYYKQMSKQSQPWLNSAVGDIVFILSPAFLALFLVLLFPSIFQNTSGIPLVYWMILIVFIDVAHVYSTLYRTYFNPKNFKEKYPLLIIIPLACYLTGVFLYQIGAIWFWRLLAYLAVYHFIRQQYGFLKLYSRNESQNKILKLIDKIAIYTATLYPLIFWHLSSVRNFNWFVDGDFLTFRNDLLLRLSGIAYLLIISVYLIKELMQIIKLKWINIPRNLIVLGTFLSWYFGIVYFNGDMAFTTLNVISHGIPYMALIWFFEKQKMEKEASKNDFLKHCFGQYGILFFLIPLILFAYLEEGLWDGLIWREHSNVFKFFSVFPQINSKEVLSLLIPLLALPQSTHYVLDGFIWKRKNNF